MKPPPGGREERENRGEMVFTEDQNREALKLRVDVDKLLDKISDEVSYMHVYVFLKCQSSIRMHTLQIDLHYLHDSQNTTQSMTSSNKLYTYIALIVLQYRASLSLEKSTIKTINHSFPAVTATWIMAAVLLTA